MIEEKVIPRRLPDELHFSVLTSQVFCVFSISTLEIVAWGCYRDKKLPLLARFKLPGSLPSCVSSYSTPRSSTSTFPCEAGLLFCLLQVIPFGIGSITSGNE